MFGKGTFKSTTFRSSSSTKADIPNQFNPTQVFLKLDEAENAANCNEISKAIQLYGQFLLNETDNSNDEVQKLKEISILKAAQLIKLSNDFHALAEFVRSLASLWKVFPRAKTAKIINCLMDLFEEASLSSVTETDSPILIEIELCKELLVWSENEKRNFLKQSLETRLISLYHRTGQYTESLELISQVLRQLKRLDDKTALIEVHLLESRVYYALKNVAKARAALTTARTYANSMYTPPLIQAALDMQAGILHAEEFDFKTAYSYFIESLDNYVNAHLNPRGIKSFKYLLLCKIMLSLPEEVESIVAGKLGQHYAMNRNFEAMMEVAKSCTEKSLKSFEKVLQTYPKELGEDAFVQSHLAALYDNLLESNILYLTLPYSRVQISFISSKIGLSPHDIEVKLSQMILDKILDAIIDHNSECLIIVQKKEGEKVDSNFGLIQNCFKNMDGVIESLVLKSKRI